STKLPIRSSRLANARACTRMSSRSWVSAQRANTRLMSASTWTSQGSTNVDPIESASGLTRFSIRDSMELKPTSAPSAWNASAIPQAIEWSFAPPKIRAFLPSRRPMPALRSCDRRGPDWPEDSRPGLLRLGHPDVVDGGFDEAVRARVGRGEADSDGP